VIYQGALCESVYRSTRSACDEWRNVAGSVLPLLLVKSARGRVIVALNVGGHGNKISGNEEASTCNYFRLHVLVYERERKNRGAMMSLRSPSKSENLVDGLYGDRRIKVRRKRSNPIESKNKAIGSLTWNSFFIALRTCSETLCVLLGVSEQSNFPRIQGSSGCLMKHCLQQRNRLPRNWDV